MEFQPLTLEQDKFFAPYWEACPEKTADYTFVNLWTWADYYKFEIAESNSLVWIKTGNGFFRAPVGDWNSIDFTKVDLLNQGITLYRTPELLKNILVEQLGQRVQVVEDKDNAEYLYKRADLAFLKGNKFHKKKNHVNNFNKNYPSTYVSFNRETLTKELYDDVVKLQDIWCSLNNCEGDNALYAEYTGIRRVLESIYSFPQLIGGALYVDKNIVGFSLGEKLDDKTLVVHFEKAHPEYRGAFQAINQNFSEKAGEDYEFIDREQDLGDPGLRQAKESYQPIGFLNKYTVTIEKS